MASQRCPRCGSDRTRRGYRPTSIFSKMLFRYNLLCDNCNWEFVGFAIPGTVSTKPKKKRKKAEGEVYNTTNNVELLTNLVATEEEQPVNTGNLNGLQEKVETAAVSQQTNFTQEKKVRKKTPKKKTSGKVKT